MDPIAGLDSMKKIKISFPRRESNLVIQPVT
jgi:hypothetical protein